MAGKYRTQIPRPPTRKRKPSVRPLTPRPKGEDERTAVRRLAAMKYRLAGATYRVIAEKLTEERAREYADAKGISVERAMKQLPHVSKRTAWDDVTAELEELRRETEMQRADLMALENARLDQVFSKALSLFANGSVPAGRLAIATMGRRCLFAAGSLPVRVPQRAGVEVRGERFVRGVAFGSESVPRSLGPRSMRRAILTEIVRKNVKNAIAKNITKPHIEKSIATVPKIPNDRPRARHVAHLPDVCAQAPAAAHVAVALPAVRRGPGQGERGKHRA